MSKDKEEIAIKVSGVSKSFKLPHEKTTSIKSFVTSPLRKRSYEKQEVLKDINFEIKKGEFFGIVGRNGSGKSTLLKLLAGIYSPDKGSIQINGKLTPFIELGVGFNPELTGRENVYLNGALLGFNRKEMTAMYEEIVEFAELERFMDQKLKNYSSGMQVRLAFSIAIRANSEILVLDEVLAVGDASFQRKCYSYFEELKRNKKTVILVTHDMENVRKYCDKALLLLDGKIMKRGNPDIIADDYHGLNLSSNNTKKRPDDNINFSARITSKRILKSGDTLKMEIKYKYHNNSPVLAKVFIEANSQPIMATNPRLLGWKEMITKDTKEHIASYSLVLKDFNKGEYKVIALLEDTISKVNIASVGYEGETLVKIENPDKSSSGGIFVNQAKMCLLK